jgi:hypothetical protein
LQNISAMIASRLTDSGVLIVQPSGPLSADDFGALSAEIDPWLDAGNRLKGLLIDVPAFPGWNDFAGLHSHLRFVRDHHRAIPRVAIATDSRFLSYAPVVARHFVSADIRHFGAGQAAAALDWLESPPGPTSPTIRSAWFPEQKLMWVSIDGRATTGEYRNLVAKTTEILAETKPISFLIDLGDLTGIEPGVVLADLKFGLSHVSDFKRVALVGNQKWTRYLAGLPHPFAMEVKAFSDDCLQDAWDWSTS